LRQASYSCGPQLIVTPALNRYQAVACISGGHGACDMEIDSNYLMLSLLFGAVGMALFLFGKKAQRIPHIVAGLALMTCPYFITNLIAMTSICVILAVVPFFMPET
jgi:hypothetical protein